MIVLIRKGWRLTLLVAAGGLCGLAAADGGEFYVRAGVGFESLENTEFLDRDCSSESPAALYGCGTGSDGAPHRSTGDFGNSAMVEFGIGRRVLPWLRIEALLGYRPRLSFQGRTNFLAAERRQSVQADVSSVSALLAMQADLKWLAVPGFLDLVPFVGVGAGAVRTRIGAMRMMFPRTTTTVPSGRHTDLAWSVNAGVALALRQDVRLELAWRYMDLGEVKTDRGVGQVEWRDGSRETLRLDLEATRATFKGHGVGVFVRYWF